MPGDISASYRQAANEFAEQLIEEFGPRIESVVLYGSVARGEATEHSDIDLLIISPDVKAIRDGVNRICEDYLYDTGYAFLITLIELSDEEFFRLRDFGSPLIKEVFRNGVILFDTGIFAKAAYAIGAG